VPADSPIRRIVLFDGVCNVCNAAVSFIIDRDPSGAFEFASLQSATGRALADRHGIGPATDTLALIEGERAYTESTAALRVARGLHRGWPALYVLVVVPRAVRDWLYRAFAAHRYAWFGKSDVCRVPTPDIRRRFLDAGE
jgi:predicted DCC family thiol-disulfide oxidoreductase YuxK